MSQTSLLDNALDTIRRHSSIRDGLRIFRTSSKDSLKSTKLAGKGSSSYYPYTVYEQTMSPIILRDSEATKKLLEAILDSPNGKRSLSRLARTCKAFSSPALDVLWRELDSIVPIVGLFPGHLLKKTKKPGMGLVRLSRFFSSVMDFFNVYWRSRLNFRVMKIGKRSSSTANESIVLPTMKHPTPSPHLSFPFLRKAALRISPTSFLVYRNCHGKSRRQQP